MTCLPLIILRINGGGARNSTGWHPASWHDVPGQDEPQHDPSSPGFQPLSASYWTALTQQVEEHGLDFVTFEDSLAPAAPELGHRDQPGHPIVASVASRLDALLLASWVAPLTGCIGLIPAVAVTHTQQFHVGTAAQRLDHLSEVRAGWQIQVSPDTPTSEAYGRREAPGINSARVFAGKADPGRQHLLDEAANVAEVSCRLMLSWDSDTEIRDTAACRFLDRDRIHPVHFQGDHFSQAEPLSCPGLLRGSRP